ncbi:MAG: nucleotidyltransferase [Flavobacterium psychrophilum]|nr:MAG: nucleotidyltransferase [Flavobacterium psychrophilum]
MSVATIFKTFSDDLLIGSVKRSTISTRYLAICTRLNKDFWGMDATSGGRYIGSFGRNTATNWVSDIDMLFELPLSTYNTYNSYNGNGQSALLQAVKNSIKTTYASTDIKGDGQIVQVSFSDGMIIELLPSFKNSDDTYTYPDSNGGGSWKNTNPIAEINAIATYDSLTNYNVRCLCRMMRSWKRYCNVPIKGILIDTLACRFLDNWAYKDKSYLYYDWMTRDFFEYLKNQPKDQTIWYTVGSSRVIYNYDNFRSKASDAYDKSVTAITLMSEDKQWSAKQKWREIYGTRFPS